MTQIKAKCIYTEEGPLENGVLTFDRGVITELVGESLQKPEKISVDIDLGEYLIIPGLVDMHIHGCVGHDVTDGTAEALTAISAHLAKTGVTSFCATTVTAPWDQIHQALYAVEEFMAQQAKPRGVQGAKVVGAYIEGPFLSAEYRGAHPQALLRRIDQNAMIELVQQHGSAVKIMALAPELDGAMAVIPALKSLGVKVAIGHSGATVLEAQQALHSGADVGVHLFNGMRPLHHREPGIVAALLNDPNAYVEIIVDFIHLHPEMVKLVLNAKDRNRICLISDSMRAMGLGDGTFVLGACEVCVANGIARTEEGSLAGSTLVLMDAVKHLTETLSIPLDQAIRMASYVPSECLGISDDVGSLAIGKKCDFVVVDEALNVLGTVVNGEWVYQTAVLEKLMHKEEDNE